MKWNMRPADSKFTAYNLFSVIAATQQRLPFVESVEHVSNLCGNYESANSFAETNNRPRVIFAEGGGTNIIAVSGAQNLSQFGGLLEGYWTEPDSVPWPHVNPFASRTATEVWSMANSYFTDISRPTLIGGYSYGSVVASGIYMLMRALRRDQQILLHTFGGPKAAGLIGNRWLSLDLNSHVRWFNDSDPVPFVIPNRLQAPQLHQALTVNASRAASLYQHSIQGNQVDFAGNVRDFVDFPTDVSGDQTQAILSWMSGAQGWNTSGHHWTSYKQRLFMAAARYLDTPRDAEPLILQAAEQVEMMGAAVQLAVTPEAMPASAPGTPTRPVEPVPLQATGRRRGMSRKTVFWNGIPVATFRTPRQARIFKGLVKRLRTAINVSVDFRAGDFGQAAIVQEQLVGTGRTGTIE